MQYPDSAVVPDYLRMLRLDGRSMVVLGAGQGIGRQAAHALAQAGARVFCVDLDAARAAAVAGEVGGIACCADVTKRADMERIFREARSALDGKVNGLVDVVGVARLGPMSDVDDAAWNAQFDIVVRHAFLAIQIGGEAIAEAGGGSMTFVGSVSGTHTLMQQAVYGTAKAALHHLVRYAARELGPKNVRVNAVAPGVVRTPRLLDMIDDALWEEIGATIALGRVAVPEEIARALLFLTSDLAAYVTGNILGLDGGVASVTGLPHIRRTRPIPPTEPR